MLPDHLRDDLKQRARIERAQEDSAEEERAEQLLNAVMSLSQEEVDAIYYKLWPNEDSKQRAFGSVQHAVDLCRKEQRARPLQLRSAFAQLRQMELGLAVTEPATPRILLVDQDASRLLVRRKILLDLKVEPTVTTSVADAVAELGSQKFQLVIVDYHPITEEDHRYLVELQGFNMQVPVINVQVWAGLIESDGRRFNRDLLRAVARLLRKPLPRRLPIRRLPATAVELSGGQPWLEMG